MHTQQATAIGQEYQILKKVSSKSRKTLQQDDRIFVHLICVKNDPYFRLNEFRNH